MSLKVWLPLIEDLHNQGCDDIVMSNTTSTFTEQGKIGTCMTLVSGNYTKAENVNIPTTNWSAAVWVKPTTSSSSANQYMVSMNTASASDFLFSLCWYTDKLGVRVGNTTYTVNVEGCQNQWTHLCGTYQNNELKIYINGVLKRTVSNPVAPVAATNLIIGRRLATGGNFVGSLNDVRIYDHCLSAAEVHEISQGLVVHYPLDNNGHGNMCNALTDRVATVAAGATEAYTTYTYLNPIVKANRLLEAGTDIIITYDYTINTMNEASLATASLYSQLNNSRLGPAITQTGLRTNPTGHVMEHFRVTASQADYTSTFRLRWRLQGVTEGDQVTISNMCMCLGTLDELEYVLDISGYGHNALAINDPTIVPQSARYTASTQFNGTDQYIRAYRGGMVRDQITVNFWIYKDSWAYSGIPISCTQTGGWNFQNSSGYIQFSCGTGESSNTYKSIRNTTSWANLSSGWHMLTGTFDGYVSKIYLDGELEGTHATPYETKTPLFYNANNGIIIGAEASGNQTTPASDYFSGCISDVRIYATALSADDILELYHTSAKIDNLGGLHSYSIEEYGGNSVTKQGLLQGDMISEIDGMSYLKYDSNIYFEPDGSAWVHIFHHNNPANGLFNSTDDFAHSVYLDEDRWFNVELCNYVTQWEVLVKRKRTTEDEELIYRWIQPANPMTASFEDVDNADCTFINGDRYTTQTTMGGIYKSPGANTYLCRNDGSTATHYYGAFGEYVIWNGGITGQASGSSNAITTGYVDLYLRIDNLQNGSPTNAKTTKNNLWLSREFIEK